MAVSNGFREASNVRRIGCPKRISKKVFLASCEICVRTIGVCTVILFNGLFGVLLLFVRYVCDTFRASCAVVSQIELGNSANSSEQFL